MKKNEVKLNVKDKSVLTFLKIELFDRSQMSGKVLLNTYIYQSEKYDDVAIKLVLKDFSVCLTSDDSSVN
jgi:hypothetical protein